MASLGFPSGSVSVHVTRCQVKRQRCSSRTCRVQKNHNILRKNTIYNELNTLYMLFFNVDNPCGPPLKSRLSFLTYSNIVFFIQYKNYERILLQSCRIYPHYAYLACTHSNLIYGHTQQIGVKKGTRCSLKIVFFP